MELTDSLEKAISAVLKFNIHCSAPLDVITVDLSQYNEVKKKKKNKNG